MIRLLNLLIAISALLVMSPILLVLPLLIKLDDGGTVFFRQERLGLHKKPFVVWKYRTMRDEEITRIGKYLRLTALDEFLQFFAILRGQMSVVGPRPITQNDVTRLGWDGENYSQRWQVIPGLTGLVQLYGGTTADHSAQLERYYLLNRSLKLDIKIILLSTAVVLIGKKRVKHHFPINIDAQ